MEVHKKNLLILNPHYIQPTNITNRPTYLAASSHPITHLLPTEPVLSLLNPRLLHPSTNLPHPSTNLPNPPIQPLQIPLQIVPLPLPLLAHRLLRSRVLVARAVVPLGDGDLLPLALQALPAGGLHAHHLAEAVDLVEDHALHVRDLVHDLELEVEGGRAAGLVRGVVPDLQVGVLERLLDADARAGVEGEEAVQQVQRVGVGGAEEGVEGDLLHAGEVADVVLGAGGADAREGLLVGGAEVVQDLVELVDVVAAFEEGLAA